MFLKPCFSDYHCSARKVLSVSIVSASVTSKEQGKFIAPRFKKLWKSLLQLMKKQHWLSENYIKLLKCSILSLSIVLWPPLHLSFLQTFQVHLKRNVNFSAFILSQLIETELEKFCLKLKFEFVVKIFNLKGSKSKKIRKNGHLS